MKKGLHSWADPQAPDSYWPYDETTMHDLTTLAPGWWVKVLIPGVRPEYISRIIDSGHPVLGRLFVKFTPDKVKHYEKPYNLLSEIYPAIKQAYNAGVRHFELFNENNLHIPDHNPEGWGVMWPNGFVFGEYVAATAVILRQLLPDATFIFPGLSPGFAIPGIRENDVKFRDEARRGVLYCDAIGLHVYWGADGSSVDTAIATVNNFVASVEKPVWITEFSNSHPHISKDVKKAEYARFFAECNAEIAFAYLYAATYDPRGESWRGTSLMELTKNA